VLLHVIAPLSVFAALANDAQIDNHNAWFDAWEPREVEMAGRALCADQWSKFGSCHYTSSFLDRCDVVFCSMLCCTITTLRHLDISVQAYQAGAVDTWGTAR
jgi:hypothetical protein